MKQLHVLDKRASPLPSFMMLKYFLDGSSEQASAKTESMPPSPQKRQDGALDSYHVDATTAEISIYKLSPSAVEQKVFTTVLIHLSSAVCIQSLQEMPKLLLFSYTLKCINYISY
jgi:hypothetical protein